MDIKQKKQQSKILGEEFDSCPNPIKIRPTEAIFEGPFDVPTKCELTITNKTRSKLICQIRVTDFDLLRARPADFFMGEMGEKRSECKIFLQTLPFEFDKNESYKDHKFVFCYAETFEPNKLTDSSYHTSTDASNYARIVPMKNWRQILIPTSYVSET